MSQELARRAPGAVERPDVPVISPDFIRPRLPEVGRIRLGEKKGAKGYPAKLDAFRFTSRDRALIQAVALQYGGEVQPWASDEGPQWQVYSTAVSIDVVVPKAELAFSQWFENWDGAVCRRRCDGHREIVGDRPCVCDPDNRACLPTTRLNVLLPDIPGMGVWRVESHGYNAAAEILGTIELAAASGATLLPATLTLAQRSKRRVDPNNPAKVQTNRFVVPVLSIRASLTEMVAEQALIRRRTLGLPTMAELADESYMIALRTAVFTRWPRSVDEPERSMRLAQLSRLLGREVTTISTAHDLTTQEAILLTNAVNELPDELETGTRTVTAGDEPREEEGDWRTDEEGAEAGGTTLGEVRTPPASAPPVDLMTALRASIKREDPAHTVETLTGPQQSTLEPESAAMAEYRNIRAAAERQHRKAVAMATTREFLVGLGAEWKAMSEAEAVAKLTDSQLESLTAMLIERLGIPA